VANDDQNAAHLNARAVHRTELFSDAVLAIAITLLALGLGVSEYHENALGDSLLSQWPSYVAFLASFVYIAVMWMNHHAAFLRVRMVSPALIWANMGILLGSVVLTFPTTALALAFQSGNAADERAAIVLYGGLAALMGVSWVVFFEVLRRDSSLWVHPGDGPMWRRVTLWAIGGAAGYLVAIAIGLAVPVLGLVMLFVLVAYRATQSSRIARMA
jgi:uncharacterized membrane protein